MIKRGLLPLRPIFVVICVVGVLLILCHLCQIYFCVCIDDVVLDKSPPPTVRGNDENVAPTVDSIYEITSRVPGFREALPGNCTALTFAAESDKESEGVKRARAWKFNDQDFYKQYFQNARDKCGNLRKALEFPNEPLSDEERDYPLAYGMLVYTSVMQVYFLLSAIYQPQNAYCIAIDGKASQQFMNGVEMLSDCLPNVFVMHVNKVRWCKFSVVRGVFSCLRYLAHLDHDWKYYQYLSGADLPLKTNLEMVRIFKQLNDSVNVEVSLQQQSRLIRLKGKKQPLSLWKSSLSSLLPRPTVNGFFAANEKLAELMDYLSQASCADESLWATLTGNTRDFPIPGSFDAVAFYKALKAAESHRSSLHSHSLRSLVDRATYEEPFSLMTYYISRYQIWGTSRHSCHGQLIQGSCAYGVKNIGGLLYRPEMVAHKFYLSVEPAAYFCVYEAVRQRAYDADGQRPFVGAAYAQLPHVRIGDGADPMNVTYFFGS